MSDVASGEDPAAEAGKVSINRDFLLHVFTFAAIPLLTLLAAQFPGTGSQIAGWIRGLLGGGH